jgi:adenine-specific DNA-methyltransferase
MTEPQDFALQPYADREKSPEAPRLVAEENLDASYPEGDRGEQEVADGGVPRRKKRNTARLVWDSKPRKAPNPKALGFQIAEVVVPNPGQAGPRLPFDPVAQEVDTSNCNRLIWGDNLLVMQALLAQGYEGKINLIYIDPPFDSKADYSHSVQLTPDGSGKGGEVTAEMSALERLAYRDTWEDGTDSYLDMLYPRLQLMHRLLAEDGSLFLHCDWHVGHYIKVMMDGIFGRGCFLNEIVWYYYNKMQGNIDHFASNHDTIYWYKKSSHLFNKIREDRGETVKQIKRIWDKEKQSLVNAKGHDGKIVYIETNEKTVDNVWRLSMLQPADKSENLNYPTQKPETVVERIIQASTKPNDLVADFFCGSGTTAAVAEKLGRRWITSDLGKAALQVARNRFVKLGEPGSGGIAFQRPDGATRCSPFVVENLGNYQRQLIYLNDTKLRQVGPLVLTLFGALPHPTERNLGTQAANDPVTGRLQRRLVLVGDPDRPLSARRVAEAVRLLSSLDGGGYAKLVALGWDFELSFDHGLQKLLGKDVDKVEARIVPTDVIEFLKKIPEGAGPEDAEVERLRDKVAFFEKPWLEAPSLEPLGWVEQDGERRLRVALRLGRYLLRSVPSGLKDFAKMGDAERQDWLRKAGGKDGLSLIDFWCVDDDLGGADGKRPFTSTWQDLRGLGKRVRRVATEMELTYVPRPGRQIGLRLVDVFGNDAAWRGLLPEG